MASTIRGNLVAPQEIFSSSSSQGTLLGTEALTGDGRRFRYVLADASTAVVVGKTYQGPAETTAWQNLACAAAAIGATSITTTATITATANQLAGGYVTVTASTGAGYIYKIKGNTAASSAVCTIYLEDPILVAMTVTSSTIDICLNPYSGIILTPGSTQSAACVGVSVYPLPVSTYGWVQVGGPVSCLIDAGGGAVGQIMVVSDDTAGAAGPFETDALFPIIGTAMTGSSSGDYGLINLNLN